MSFPKIEGYVVTEKLGSGSYSTVYKAYTKVGARSIVAIKCVDKSSIKNSGSAVDNLITEIRLLKTLTHPHIVHMKHFTWDDRNIYIIMEYCCGGDLSKYIHRYGRVPEKQVLYFLQQLASALKFLREKGVVHMDLKPHNLLLHKGSDGKYILKVADFGFAQYMSSSWRRCVRGSPLYMAPEMVRGDYDARVDLWSVGVIMYECLFGRAPYSSRTFKELVDKIQAQAPIEIPPNSSVSPGCLDLLTRLLQHDPAARISYDDFFAHEYLDLDHMPSRENYEKAVTLIKQAIDLDCSGQVSAAFRQYRAALRLLVPAAAAEPDPVRRTALTAKLTRYMERAEEIKEYLKTAGSVDLAEERGMRACSPAPPSPQRRRDRPTACCVRGNGSCEYGEVRTNLCKCVGGQSGTSAACVNCGGTGEVRGTVEQAAFSVTNGAEFPPRTGPAPTQAGTYIPTGGQHNNTRGTNINTEGTATPDQSEGGTTSDKEGTIPNAGGIANDGGGTGGRKPRFALRRLFSRQSNVPYLNNNDSSIVADNSEKSDKSSNEPNEVCRIT